MKTYRKATHQPPTSQHFVRGVAHSFVADIYWYRRADGNLRKRFWTKRLYSSFSQGKDGHALWLKEESSVETRGSVKCTVWSVKKEDILFSFRVMTFNIHGMYAWEKRAQLNVEVIQIADPDLIGFQELEEGNLAVYQRQLSGYEYRLGAKIDDGYNAIFWKPTVLTYIDSSSFWLSETPDVVSHGWGAVDLRAAHWIRFQVVGIQRELLHVNTHLDHRIEHARLEGARLILQRLRQSGRDEVPVLLTGDFNCDPDSATYRLLQEHGFVDTYRATHHTDKEYADNDSGDSKYSNTMHAYGWTKPSSSGAIRQGVIRFDWILYQDRTEMIQSTSCEIIRRAEPPIYPSDHYPVLVEFKGV